jgi:hypothetical protein
MVLLITSVIYTRKEVYTIYEALAYSKYLSMLRRAQIQWCRALARGQSGLLDADFVKKIREQ